MTKSETDTSRQRKKQKDMIPRYINRNRERMRRGDKQKPDRTGKINISYTATTVRYHSAETN